MQHIKEVLQEYSETLKQRMAKASMDKFALERIERQITLERLNKEMDKVWEEPRLMVKIVDNFHSS